jgi:hypothetical protein
MKNIDVEKLVNGSKFVDEQGNEWYYIGEHPFNSEYKTECHVAVNYSGYKGFFPSEMFEPAQELTGYVRVYKQKGNYFLGKVVYDTQQPCVDPSFVKYIKITETIS